MPAFTEENREAILAACSGNVDAAAEALSRCFKRSFRVEIGVLGTWSTTQQAGDLHEPGILIHSQLDSQGFAVLIPEALPLPERTVDPADIEQSRLNTLASELSRNLLPAGFAPQASVTRAVPDLAHAIRQMAPSDWAATLGLLVFDAGSAEAAAPAAKLMVVWPLTEVDLLAEQLESPAEIPVAAVPMATAKPAVDPLARLRHLPVQVSVRLAEKRISMSQLMNITPGMLIPFSKSCEDLLDLYVNNARFCRGEAVKIGEKFGLKINQVGVKTETPHKVIDA